MLPDLDIPVRKKSNAFYVYVFHIQDTSIYKIGYTTHLRQRLFKINCSFPFEVVCIKYYKFTTSDEALQFESHLFRYFKNKRLINKTTNQPKEWFMLDNRNITELDDVHSIFIKQVLNKKNPTGELVHSILI
jgi:hypothetical protein